MSIIRKTLVKPMADKAPFGTDLTRKEKDVLLCIASGQKRLEIASMMNLSPFTVRQHQNRIRQKLGAKSLPHAVALALEKRQVSFQDIHAFANTLAKQPA